MEFYGTPKLGVIYPCDDLDAEKLRSMRQGEVYRIKVSMPRNVRFHRKFMAMIGVVYDNIPEGFSLIAPNGAKVEVRTRKDLLWHIKMQLGLYEKRVTLGGKVCYEAGSISFAAMDEAEFSEFYSAAIDVIIKHFLVGVNRQELEDIIIMQFT